MASIARSYNQATSTPHFVRFITSWCLPPLALACVRALFALYIFTTLFTDIGFLSSKGSDESVAEFFSYFTILTYWGLGFYFAVSAGHGILYAVRRPCGLAAGSLVGPPSAPETMTGLTHALRFAHSAYYSTVTVFPFIVTGVFWGVLAQNALVSRFSTWANLSEHALNSAFALFEVIVPRTDPNPWIHLLTIIIILALYLSLAFLSHAINHFYVYSFLDIPRKGSAFVAVAIVLILVASIVVFAIIHGIIYLRKRLTESKMHCAGKFSTYDNRLPGAELEVSKVQMDDITTTGGPWVGDSL